MRSKQGPTRAPSKQIGLYTSPSPISFSRPGFEAETHVMRIEAEVQWMISLKREPARDVTADPYRDAAHRTPTAVGRNAIVVRRG